MRMRSLLALSALVSASFIPASSPAQGSGYGQVMLENRMPDLTIDLYVDDNYGCRAGPGFTCTTHVRAGLHYLKAKATDGQETGGEAYVEEGRTFTYTISPSD
jgi:hypothetical protein